MKTNLRHSLSLLGVVFLFSALAQAEVSTSIQKKIVEGLAKGQPGLQFDNVQETPLKGLYQVQVVGGPLLYTDKDGSHFIAGDLYSVGEGHFVNLAEKSRAAERKRLFDKVSESTTLRYAPDGQAKGYIRVFTDVNCPYCRKFHNEILPELLKLGVGVEYYAYPVIGGELSHKQMTSAWCSDKPLEALTALKQKKTIPEKTCDDSPVDIHVGLGRSLGVSGTPSVFLPDGSKVDLGPAMFSQIAQAFNIDLK